MDRGWLENDSLCHGGAQIGSARPLISEEHLGLAFGFLWISLEIRHGFAGAVLTAGHVGQAELWAYSAVWLLGAVAVLLGGIHFGSTLFRRGASLNDRRPSAT